MDYLLVASFTYVAAVLLWFLRKYFEGGWCYSKARLDGKTVIVTGAGTGIGKETARDLARRGARIILACCDVAEAEAAAAQIRAETGNSDVVVRKLDLASLASVREFAEKIKSEESKLDILINNAGIICPEWKTEDGFEMQFGVNHLGHFLLTNLLLDLIKSSAPARIINVSSIGHQAFGKMHWDDIHMRRNYDALAAYGQSKLANVLFTRELAKRLQGSGVTVNALHPGSAVTKLDRHADRALSLRWKLVLGTVMNPLVGILTMKTAVKGAQTTIHCAVAEELKDVTGLYFSDCAPKEPSPEALDDESARRLWELSAEMVNLEKKIE